MEWEMFSPPVGAYIPSFTIYHVLPDLPEHHSGTSNWYQVESCMTYCTMSDYNFFATHENCKTCTVVLNQGELITQNVLMKGMSRR
jgi:hypothetical protein